MSKFNKEDYLIEYSQGKVGINTKNILVNNIVDMEILEYWEERLRYLKEDFTIAYRNKESKVVYTVFCNIRKKGSSFK